MGSFAEVLTNNQGKNIRKISNEIGEKLETFNDSLIVYKAKSSTGVATTSINPNKTKDMRAARISIEPKSTSRANASAEDDEPSRICSITVFLLYINDLNQAIKFCKVHHFADDTNLLCLRNSAKKLNKLFSADLKHLGNWLNANKISINLKKTEIVIFKSKEKKFEGDLKIKLCGKGLYPTESVKYLVVKIDANLSWQYHINDLSIKLNRDNVLLFKMRKYVSLKILRSIHFAIFDSYLSYCCLIWAQNCRTITQIIILQKKAIRIINLQPRNSHTSSLFK